MKWQRFLLALVALPALASYLFAQSYPGQFPNSSLFGNFSGSAAVPGVISVPACANDGVHALTNNGSNGFNCQTIELDPSFMRGYISGLTMSNDATTPNTVIDTSAGVATSDDATALIKLAAFTKTTGAWTLGTGNGCLDAGSVGNNLWYSLYTILRIDTGVVDELCSLAAGQSSAVTITIASPAVVTWTASNLQVGTPVSFATTGSLPTGITAGTQYYVISAGLGTNSFEISTSVGGAAVNTSGSQSGTQTAMASPVMPANYTKKRRIGSFRTNASANILGFFQNADTFLWANLPSDGMPAGTGPYDYTATNPGTGQVTVNLVNAPIGVRTQVMFNLDIASLTSPTPPAVQWRVWSPDTPNYFSGGGIGVVGLNFTDPGATITSALVWDNPGAQMLSQLSASDAMVTVLMQTTGWIDPRGRFN